MTNYICNFKKSPLDKRDYIFHSKGDFPDTLDYRPQLQKIRNQGGQGTCYAQSAACMKEWQEKIDEYFSPQFFYNNRENDNDDGMYGRDVMKLLMEIGICKEGTYPYGRVENKKYIPRKVYKEAEKYRIKSYARVNSIDDLKRSLFKNGPCLIALPVYNYGPEFWRPQLENYNILGGHAVTVIGYDEEGFILRNSWSKKWADKGYTKYKYKDWGYHWEIWTTVDIDNDEVYVPPKKKRFLCLIL